MGIIHSIMTLLYLILLCMAKYIPWKHGPLIPFQVILWINVFTAWISITTQRPPYEGIFLIIILFTVLFIKQRDSLLSQPDGRWFLWRLSCYIIAIISLCVGSLLLSTIMPTFIRFWFELLYALSLVFLMSFPYYLYFSWYLRHTHPKKAPDTLLVLGAGIETESVSPLLQARLDAALSISHKDTQWIVSGGQGADEPISEALAMQRYLIQQGVSKTHILLEAQSTNTQENITYSRPLIETDSHSIIVTSDFHLMRALRIAQQSKLPANGYGAISPLRYRARSYLHDYCGLLLHHPVAWFTLTLLLILSTLL
ncbi:MULTISPECIES: YdcF family protein [unclassified Staphylococcus]|uniref:YdcF family protein n=1 Tax=unclassified Staphylococcus TaxID=91994 RepID=UPI0021D22556|nr:MULTISPECIES: YdcF family protein [unclassified Staphylococcus]UXR78083.1 YdcF family protein [Staphylococcus sp. IVB6227]UXR82246.1 YdcF family protein [Staphylococcus sp. IVB6214]